MKNVTILLAVAAVLAMSVPAYGVFKNNHVGLYEDTNSWTDGNVPNGANGVIDDGGTCEIESTTTATPNNLYVGARSSSRTGVGTVEMDDGTLTVGGRVYVGYQKDAGCTGTGTFTQSGGDVVAHYIDMGTTGGVGTYTISGGTIDIAYSMIFRSAGVTVFEVKGATATINTYAYYQEGGTLKVQLDSSGAISPITVDGGSARDNEVTGTLVIDDGLVGSGTLTEDDRVTLLDISTANAGSTLDYSSLTESNADWNIVRSGDTGYDEDLLQIVYVPEPATMCLLGIGGLGVLIRRRKK